MNRLSLSLLFSGLAAMASPLSWNYQFQAVPCVGCEAFGFGYTHDGAPIPLQDRQVFSVRPPMMDYCAVPSIVICYGASFTRIGSDLIVDFVAAPAGNTFSPIEAIFSGVTTDMQGLWQAGRSPGTTYSLLITDPPTSDAPASAPEPATWGFMGVAALGCAIHAYRRKSAK